MVNFQQPNESPLLEWKAPQDVHHTRSKTWYACAITFVIGCIAYSIWTQAWTFTTIIGLVAIAYWKTHKDAPLEKRVRLWKQGLAINNTFYAWSECEGYWILKGPQYFEVHFEKKNGGDIKVQTGEIDGYLLHDVLLALLPELTDRKEKLLDTIIRICKL